MVGMDLHYVCRVFTSFDSYHIRDEEALLRGVVITPFERLEPFA